MKTIVITGASDGIGKAAARALHGQGHRVVLIGRSAEKTKALARELDAPYYLADFSKLADVRKLAASLKRDYKRIDVLALNAGGIFNERVVTKDGFEQTYQVNHLAHFLLTGLLMNTLIRNRATIITTSSAAHWFARLKPELHNPAGRYSKWTTYGMSKLLNILFVRELKRRYGKKGISAAAFHPGIVRSSFTRGTGPIVAFLYHNPLSRMMGIVTPEQGADTLVWLATTDPARDWKSGEFYVKRKIARTSSKAGSKSLANQVWNESEDLLLDKLDY